MAFTIREREPLAAHTVFRIGGPARFFIEADTADDVLAALRGAVSSGLPWLMLGAGSNVLAADGGFGGCVIRASGGAVVAHGGRLRVDAGVSMARVVGEALRFGLRGFEWAIGVPGTVGGSVRGNAGCFGGAMADAVESVSVFNAATDGVEEWAADACEFSYRSSVFKRRPELAVLGATLRLEPGDPAEGGRFVRQHTAERTRTQDIGAATAGCMFKNIPWGRIGGEPVRRRLIQRHPDLAPFTAAPAIPAGLLIDRAGLKGFCVGRARVSERHGNFFVNVGGATAEDILILTSLAKGAVRRHFGLLLEEEIQYVGFEQ